jgi:hypothetical protein
VNRVKKGQDFDLDLYGKELILGLYNGMKDE